MTTPNQKEKTMTTTTTYPPLSPTQIAEALRAARPDLHIEIDAHGPAGLTLVATSAFYENDPYTPGEILLFGTAAGYLGWSDGDGENGGGWEGLIEDTYQQWEADEPMADGMVALARIAQIVAENLEEEL